MGEAEAIRKEIGLHVNAFILKELVAMDDRKSIIWHRECGLRPQAKA
jgi:hypothetical protein